MFTGIIETTGKILDIIQDGSNLNFWVSAPISTGMKIDQSVAHQGVCLTVVDLMEKAHMVTAVEETLKKTNLATLKVGDSVNLERCMPATGRFDGHIVQGHVDDQATLTEIKVLDGSYLFYFHLHQEEQKYLVVDKGSICINGVSLTVVHIENSDFYVTIIPYTFENTTFKKLKVGDQVNIEFDILGKYIRKNLQDRA